MSSVVFSPGDVVIECQPFVIQVTDEFRDQRCHYCLKECDDLKTCAKCHQVKYCSKECQLKDWKDIHKFKECKLLKTMGSDCYELDYEQRILIRLLLKTTFDTNSEERVHRLWDNRERRLTDLITHEDKKDVMRAMKMCSTYELVSDMFNKLSSVKLDIDRLWRLLCIIHHNWMGLEIPYEDRKIVYATAVFIESSAMQHECKPSCFAWYYGRTMHIRAMRTIDTTVEQPTLCYITFWSKPPEFRRRLLAAKYIDCQCKRCVNEEDKDWDFDRYDYLANGVRDYSDEELDEMLAFKRLMFGDHYPDITLLLFFKLIVISDTVIEHRIRSGPLIQQMTQLYEEVVRELDITHGQNHYEYPVMNGRLEAVKKLVLLLNSVSPMSVRNDRTLR